MESEGPASCFSDPNFAIIAGFVEKFGKVCGVAFPAIADLAVMLEAKDAVPQDLILLHVYLLRKIRRSVPIERWEKSAVKYCQQYSLQDAAILEQHGYLNCGLDIKLRFLKNLLESQFDYNQKLKTAVNLLTAEELRPKPVGRDESGRVYWVQLDPSGQLRVYREEHESDGRNWILVAQDRDSLVKLLHELSGDESMDLTAVVDVQDTKDTPVLDTGQNSEDSDDDTHEDAILLSDGAAELDDDDDDDDGDAVKNVTSKKVFSLSDSACSEAIEEPVMHVSGDGNGAACDASRPVYNGDNRECQSPNFLSSSNVDVEFLCSEVVEDPVFYVYGPGNGVDCDVGNQDKDSSCEESSQINSLPSSTVGNLSEPVNKLNEVGDILLNNDNINVENCPSSTKEVVSTLEPKKDSSCNLATVEPEKKDPSVENNEGLKSQHRVWSISDICGSQSSETTLTTGKPFTIENVLIKAAEENVKAPKSPNMEAISGGIAGLDRREESSQVIMMQEEVDITLQEQRKNAQSNIEERTESLAKEVEPENVTPARIEPGVAVKECDSLGVEEISSVESVTSVGNSVSDNLPSSSNASIKDAPTTSQSTLMVPEIIITPNTPTNSSSYDSNADKAEDVFSIEDSTEQVQSAEKSDNCIYSEGTSKTIKMQLCVPEMAISNLEPDETDLESKTVGKQANEMSAGSENPFRVTDDKATSKGNLEIKPGSSINAPENPSTEIKSDGKSAKPSLSAGEPIKVNSERAEDAMTIRVHSRDLTDRDLNNKKHAGNEGKDDASDESSKTSIVSDLNNDTSEIQGNDESLSGHSKFAREHIEGKQQVSETILRKGDSIALKNRDIKNDVKMEGNSQQVSKCIPENKPAVNMALKPEEVLSAEGNTQTSEVKKTMDSDVIGKVDCEPNSLVGSVKKASVPNPVAPDVSTNAENVDKKVCEEPDGKYVEDGCKPLANELIEITTEAKTTDENAIGQKSVQKEDIVQEGKLSKSKDVLSQEEELDKAKIDVNNENTALASKGKESRTTMVKKTTGAKGAKKLSGKVKEKKVELDGTEEVSIRDEKSESAEGKQGDEEELTPLKKSLRTRKKLSPGGNEKKSAITVKTAKKAPPEGNKKRRATSSFVDSDKPEMENADEGPTDDESTEENAKDPLATDEDDKNSVPEMSKASSKKTNAKKRGNNIDVTSKPPTTKKTDDSNKNIRSKKTNDVSAREMKLLGVNINAVVANVESDRSVRTSRRIAQIKIKEQQERRKEEEFQLATFKKTGKKTSATTEKNDFQPSKKKKSKKSKKKKVDVEDEDYQDEEESKDGKSKKKHKKLKFSDQNPWLHSSDSSTVDEDLEDYEEEEEPQEEHVLKSDHEFSPESDMDDDPEYIPVQKARTAAPGDDKYEDTSCEACKSAERGEWILLCDGCDKGWHTDCLKPVHHLVPEGQWFCPPCSHASLIDQLKLTLREFDRLEKQRENEELRKKRLAFVGISIDNVLPSKKKKDEKKESDSGSDSSGSDSGSTSSDSEPIYQLRERRTNVTSYRYNEYDEMIRSAIQEDLPPPPSKPAREIEDDEETEDDEIQKEPVPVTANNKQAEPPVVKKDAPPKDKDKEGESSEKDDDDYAGETEEDDLVDELPPVVPRDRNDAKKKKRKRLTMDFSSDEEDDHNSDSDFKGSTEESESEDASASGSSDDWARKKRGPVRRSTRARRRRYDKDFINDGTSDEEEGKSKKRSRRDLCSDESSDSDRSWGGSGKRKRSRRIRLPTPPRWAKKKKKHKKHKRSDGSDQERPKKRRIKYGGLDDSDDDRTILTRRTRGRKINYIEENDDDSEEELKNNKKKKDSGESDDEFVAEAEKEDEEEEDDKEGNYVDEEETEDSEDQTSRENVKTAPSTKPKGKTKGGKSKQERKSVKKNRITDSESEEDVDQDLEDLDDEEEEKLLEILEKGDLPVDQLKAAVKRAKEERKQKTGEISSEEKMEKTEVKDKTDAKPKRKNVKITPTRAELEAVKEKNKKIKTTTVLQEDIAQLDVKDDSLEKPDAGVLLLKSLQGDQEPNTTVGAVGLPAPVSELPATIPSALASPTPNSPFPLDPHKLQAGPLSVPAQQSSPRMLGPHGARGQFQPIHHGNLPPHQVQIQGLRQPPQNMQMGGQYPRPNYPGPHPVGLPLRGNGPPGQYPQGPPGSHTQNFRPQGPHSQIGPMASGGPPGPSPMLQNMHGVPGPIMMRPQGMQGLQRPPGPQGMHIQGPPGQFMKGQHQQGGPPLGQATPAQLPPSQQMQSLQNPVGGGMPLRPPMLGPQHTQAHIPPSPGPGVSPVGAQLPHQPPYPQPNVHSPLSDPPETVKQRRKPGPKPGSKNKKKTDEEPQSPLAPKGRGRGKKADDVTIATVQAPTQFPDAVAAEGGSVITRMLNAPQGARPAPELANPRFPGPQMYHAAHPMDPSPSGGAAVSVPKPPFGQENFSQFQMFQRQHYSSNFPAEQAQNFESPPFSESSNFVAPSEQTQPTPQPQVAQSSTVAGKAFEEEVGGEFGGLASYFASQAEDDIDT